MASKRIYDPYMCVNCVIILDDSVLVKDEMGKVAEVYERTGDLYIKEIRFEDHGIIRIEVKANVKKPLDMDMDSDVSGGKLFWLSPSFTTHQITSDNYTKKEINI